MIDTVVFRIAALGDDTFEELHRALLDYLVVFFRGQDMTPRQQIALGKRFGELDIHPYVAGMPDCPEIIHVIREPEDTGFNFGGDWHSDVTFQERPALGSILYAEEVPAYGGDTPFANQYLAYETLSDGMKSLLEGLEALHSASRPYGLHNTRGDRHKYAVNTHSMKVRYSEDADGWWRTRWCARTRKPGARPCTSTARSRTASRT